MTTTKIENAIMGDIKKDGSTVKVIFDRSMGKEVHLIVDLDDSLGYANGCVGVSVKVVSSGVVVVPASVVVTVVSVVLPLSSGR